MPAASQGFAPWEAFLFRQGIDDGQLTFLFLLDKNHYLFLLRGQADASTVR